MDGSCPKRWLLRFVEGCSPLLHQRLFTPSPPFSVFGFAAQTGEWLPEATLDAYRKYLVGIKGPLTTPIGGGIRSLNVALRQVRPGDAFRMRWNVLECARMRLGLPFIALTPRAWCRGVLGSKVTRRL